MRIAHEHVVGAVQQRVAVGRGLARRCRSRGCRRCRACSRPRPAGRGEPTAPARKAARSRRRAAGRKRRRSAGSAGWDRSARARRRRRGRAAIARSTRQATHRRPPESSCFPIRADFAGSAIRHCRIAAINRPKWTLRLPCRSSRGRRIILIENKDRAPARANCAPRGGNDVRRQDLRNSGRVEAARLHRRSQVPGDVPALGRRPERLLGRAGQAHRLDQAVHARSRTPPTTRTTSRSNGSRTAR